MITTLKPALLQQLNAFVADQMRSFYPVQPSEEVAARAPDLINKTAPGDMSLTSSGTLVAAEISPMDIGNRSGCPSPGIWMLFWPLQVIAIITFALSASACLLLISRLPVFYDALMSQSTFLIAGVLAMAVASFVLRGALSFAAKWATIIGAFYLLGGAMLGAAGYYYKVALAMDMIVIVPTLILGGAMLLVISEQELSPNLFALMKTGAAAKLLVPIVFAIKIWSGTTRGGMLMKIVGTLLLVIALPILLPATTALLALIAMFLHRLLLTAYFAGREKLMKDTARDARQAGMRKDITVFEAARTAQLAKVMTDDTHLFPLGTSKGNLRRDGDLLTPDEGGILGLTEKDLRTNLWVFGRMGSGKTDSVARPLVYKCRQAGGLGMLLMDGKSALSLEMAAFLDKVVDPFRTKLNILAGVDPEPASLIFRSVCGDKKGDGKGGNDIWTTTPEAMIRQALFVIRAMHDPQDAKTLHYCIRDLHAFCMNQSTQKARLVEFFDGGLGNFKEDHGFEIKESAAKRLAGMPSYLRVAFEYFLTVFPSLPVETRGSVSFTVDAWLSNMISHSIMHRWSGHESSINIVDAIDHGAMIGVSAPEEICGSGGALGLALIKEALYQRLLARGADPAWESKGGKPVMILVDEVSTIVSETDVNAASKLRGLQGSMVFMTQNLGQIQSRLGEKGADALLACFSSAITFKSSEATLQWAAKHAGMRHRVITDKQAVDVSRLMDDVSANSAASDGKTGRLGALVDTATDSIVHLRGQASISKESGDHATESRKSMTLKGTYEHTTTVTAEELDMYLSEPHVALVTLNRAGAPRREIAGFEYIAGHEMYKKPTKEELEEGLLPPDTYIAGPRQSDADLLDEANAWLAATAAAVMATEADVLISDCLV